MLFDRSVDNGQWIDPDPWLLVDYYGPCFFLRVAFGVSRNIGSQMMQIKQLLVNLWRSIVCREKVRNLMIINNVGGGGWVII
jgi:hypothetical protein